MSSSEILSENGTDAVEITNNIFPVAADVVS